jgi:hypothetical protein
MSSRKNDSEFKPIVPLKPGDDNYPTNMIKLANFEVDNLATITPGT